MDDLDMTDEQDASYRHRCFVEELLMPVTATTVGLIILLDGCLDRSQAEAFFRAWQDYPDTAEGA